MNLFNTQKLTLFAAFLVVSLFTLQACGTDAHDHDHADAVGFVIEQNNAEVLRFENNQANWNPDGAWDDYYRDGIDAIVISPDVIQLTEENPRGMTPSVVIRWIDPDGDVFDLPDDEGGEFSLTWEWEKPNTVGDTCSDEARENVDQLDNIRPANLEQHGSDGLWGFHFRADHAGQDRLRFSLMHEDHADFTSGWINVEVPHDEHDLIDENGIYMHTRDKCRVDRPQ